MRIAVIGTGHIGRALAPLLARSGHDVVFGSEHPEEDQIEGVAVLTVSKALEAREIVIVAIPFGAWADFAREHGDALGDKIVIDTTNTNSERDGAIVQQVKAGGHGTLVYVAGLLPSAKLVKAFNTMTAEVLASGAKQPHRRLAYPVAGNDAAAKSTVAALVRDAGFDPVVLGGVEDASRFDEGTPVWNNPMSAAALSEALA